ncbi:unnamed protein product [Prorocentrum cordatum]|uniref:Uncharacterized protein n=1 Tax=Prorocentrum cordatum TaxID=2364126 RepID=A0ABN9SRE8_9DINO|nr:unnamed protein product [Polarella glacialis]
MVSLKRIKLEMPIGFDSLGRASSPAARLQTRDIWKKVDIGVLLDEYSAAVHPREVLFLRRRAARGTAAALAVACATTLAAQLGFAGSQATPGRARAAALRASPVDQINNPIKTVADTIADFYKTYPQPPLLPMYRPFVMDLMKQVHLAAVDSRFKYDAIFGLGLREAYVSLMGAYDKIGGCKEVEKIWPAFAKACSLDGKAMQEDAEAVASWAKSTSPAQVLQVLEGAEAASDPRVSTAVSNIKTSLYNQMYSIGIFKMMEYSGVAVTKDNVEEWAKALKVPPSKPATDLETYKRNMDKLQKAEEMMREVEIREKKKLAERLEEKAKALAAKAAAASAAKTDEPAAA